MSIVSICNTALSNIGDAGLITSLADGSTQSARCALYYPLARRQALEQGSWTFANTRDALGLSGTATGSWLYRYAFPSTALRVDKVLSEVSEVDEPSEPFLTEVDVSTGSRTILTNAESATAVFVFDQQDATQFTPSFETVLSYLLASFLAGPIIKGRAGREVSQEMLKLYISMRAVTATSDAANVKPDRSARVPRGIQARV